MGMLSGMLAGALEGGAHAADQVATQEIKRRAAVDYAREIQNMKAEADKRAAEWMQSEEYQGFLRKNEAAAIKARGAATLETDVARASNPELRAARVVSENALIEGTTAARAKAEGMLTRARAENQPFDLSPGQQRFIGAERVASNDRPTPAEVTKELYSTGLKSDGGRRTDRVSEATRIQLTAIEKRDSEVQSLIDKGIADGSLSPTPGPDGKPTDQHQRWQHLVQQRQAGAIQRLRLLASEGVISGDEDAARVIDSERNPETLKRAKAQAALIGGEYSRTFGAAIDRALSEMATPEKKREAVAAEAARQGDTNYIMDIGGQRSKVGDPRERFASVRPGASPINQPTEPDSSAGIALDQARQELAAARSGLQSFGSIQRGRDPTGFEKARLRHDRAKTLLREAEAAYFEQLSSDADTPAFTFAKP